MKSLQHAHGKRHGLGIEHAVTKDPFAKSRDFAIFVQGFQPAAHHAGYFQAD
jgi:hypothetical protein